jgi:hypothetical protein
VYSWSLIWVATTRFSTGPVPSLAGVAPLLPLLSSPLLLLLPPPPLLILLLLLPLLALLVLVEGRSLAVEAHTAPADCRP